uniref:Uncharacterized protein n=1 Tax=Parastrongyloides trichosuri TaxID=131310 RepID=A0A0N5A5N5_PARTI
MLYEVKGWTYCWSTHVSINLELNFSASVTKSANIHDIYVYERETFGWQTNIYEIYSLNTDQKTPTNWTITTTGPITLWAGFSLFGEIRYKALRKNGFDQLVLCEDSMRFNIPDHCTSCRRNPPKCVGSIDLDKKISKIDIKK